MKKLIPALIISSTFYLPAHAYYIEAGNHDQIMRIIKQAAIQQRADFCNFDDGFKEMEAENGKIYILYETAGYVDKSTGICSGGSGTSSMHIAELQGNRVLRVDLLRSLPKNINTEIIEEIRISQNGILSFKNYEYGEGDGNCCPSGIYLNQIRLSDMRLIRRQYLGRDIGQE